jgi:hypothetical protein
MSNQAFITMDERLVLQVPSLQERSIFDNGRGYELTDLEASISSADVTTLKPFQQSACQDPVAVQVFKTASKVTNRKCFFVVLAKSQDDGAIAILT